MSYIAEAHAEWHMVNGPWGCPLDCALSDPYYDQCGYCGDYTDASGACADPVCAEKAAIDYAAAEADREANALAPVDDPWDPPF